MQVPQQLELPLPDDIKEEVKAQWAALAASVDSLRPIERYQVVGIAYRRHALFRLSIFTGLNLAHRMAGCVCLCCCANALTGSACPIGFQHVSTGNTRRTRGSYFGFGLRKEVSMACLAAGRCWMGAQQVRCWMVSARRSCWRAALPGPARGCCSSRPSKDPGTSPPSNPSPFPCASTTCATLLLPLHSLGIALQLQ